MRVRDPETGKMVPATTARGRINYACGDSTPVEGITDRNTLPAHCSPHDCPTHGPTTVASIALSGPAEILWPDPKVRAEVEEEIRLDKLYEPDEVAQTIDEDGDTE